jgi:RNA polymerase sigma-70 factor, ECF subfamily
MIAHSVVSYDDLIAALPRLRRYAWVLTGDLNRADALVQEALTRMQERHALDQGQKATQVWLFDALRKAYLASTSRHDRTARSSSDVAGAAERDSPETRSTTPSAALSTSEIVLQLMRLPVDQREVLLLVSVEGLHYRDIAALLDVPIGTVLSRLNGARNNLK